MKIAKNAMRRTISLQHIAFSAGLSYCLSLANCSLAFAQNSNTKTTAAAESAAESKAENTDPTAKNSNKAPEQQNKPSNDEGRQQAHERLQRLKTMQVREKTQEKTGSYHNAAMSFSTQIPEGCQITELGDRSMRAFLPRAESFLSFAATAQPVSPQVDLSWFFQQVIQHLPPSWKILRQESTTLDGNKGYALEAEENHPSGNTYRQRIYVMRNQKIMIFDVSCPIENVTSNNASIKTIWAQLRL